MHTLTKVSEQMNRKCPPRNTILQLLTQLILNHRRWRLAPSENKLQTYSKQANRQNFHVRKSSANSRRRTIGFLSNSSAGLLVETWLKSLERASGCVNRLNCSSLSKVMFVDNFSWSKITALSKTYTYVYCNIAAQRLDWDIKNVIK